MGGNEREILTTTNLGGKEKETSDPIEDMGKYIHTILDSDDEEAKQCKQEYNTALAMNTKMHIIHDNIKHLSESENEKTDEKEDLKPEESFEKIWDLSSTKEEDSSVKNICESLEKLNLDNNQESDNSDSSTDTVIETKKEKLSPEKEKRKTDASLSPIPGGEEFSIVHSPGMESKNELDSTKEKEKRKPYPHTSSGRYRYGSQVIHEENCDCPYCYV